MNMKKKINAVNGYIIEGGLQVVECNGKKFGLLEDAVVYFDDMEAIAKAVMIGDKIEKNYADVYYLKWKIDNDYKPDNLSDLSDACDWENPDDVIFANAHIKVNNKLNAYVVDKEELKELGIRSRNKYILMDIEDFFSLINVDKIETKPLFKKNVFEYAPKNAVIVDGHYALMSSPVKAKSPYNDEEIEVALAVDMSDKIIDNRWAQTYRIYWFKGDSFKNPSMIGQEDLVEISPDIFITWRKEKAD